MSSLNTITGANLLVNKIPGRRQKMPKSGRRKPKSGGQRRAPVMGKKKSGRRK